MRETTLHRPLAQPVRRSPAFLKQFRHTVYIIVLYVGLGSLGRLALAASGSG